MAIMTQRPVRQAAAEGSGLRRGLLPLMAVATGLTVASNYLPQPLLHLIGGSLGLGTGMAGLIVTAAQVGYGIGLFLLVPLGDLVERRRLSVSLYVLTAGFLLISALAPNGAVLLAGTALTALTSVAAQVVVPFAASLAAPAERGRVVGTVMMGLLLGVLLARTVSGALAELGGWRTVYWVQAGLMLLMAVLLRRALPTLHTPAGMRYPKLLGSIATLIREEPVLRWRMVLGALSFAAFSALWTSLTFLLSGGPYNWSEGAIGLMGLFGALGSVVANVAGRLADRGHVHRVTGAAAVIYLVAWLPLALGGHSLAWLIVGIIVLDLAQQALLISNQHVVYALQPEARNRINSAFMTGNFVGGALGSALASLAWTHGGWPSVAILGAALSAGMLVSWSLERLTTR
ncbi:MFS transporter [Actinomadura rupiterrae]|uniref:MFS transporter n=1 Tax=Actinomadura rupiterrae TaxID=559627 RepID=UPI0020A5E015|nr:MFS transporter [Actinomadura rupiterrae]MCP2334795.1 putative MFS family arabinose efflux permease [Actinomadura rupiterrae]